MACTTLIYQTTQNYFSKWLRQFLMSLTTLYEMSSSWPALDILRVLANLTDLKRYFLVLICISLITDQLEHPFVFMLIHFFEFILLASPIIQLLFDFSSWFLEILHSLTVELLLDMHFKYLLQISDLSISCVTFKFKYSNLIYTYF